MNKIIINQFKKRKLDDFISKTILKPANLIKNLNAMDNEMTFDINERKFKITVDEWGKCYIIDNNGTVLNESYYYNLI